MAITIEGTLVVQDQRGVQHTIEGDDFNIDVDVYVEERAQGQESIHEASYEPEGQDFSVIIDIAEYPVGAYNHHEFRFDGCTLVQDDLEIGIEPDAADPDAE